ncbi:helix-turn-helix domain-containing protein [Pseudoalteromonas luteoviolacea]|uniref:helix-turn-helix domain-containing protein n=1 Tax=Pseudoalteromonas luteoviolacea TaxID=43657 RepID=UPI0009BD5936
MIDDLKSIAIFAAVVEHGSFRGAAKALKLSPSVVSYHISTLEKSLIQHFYIVQPASYLSPHKEKNYTKSVKKCLPQLSMGCYRLPSKVMC